MTKKYKVTEDDSTLEIPTVFSELEVVEPEVKVVDDKVKQEVTLYSSASNLEMMTNRIKDRYGATLKSKTDDEYIFEGKSFKVILKIK